MKLSKYYSFTLREDPNEAFLNSHKLMLRAGMIRQATSGIYTWLPLGLKVLNKIKDLIREIHIKNDIYEILMPTIQPSDIWKKSGRFNDYGKEMLKIYDRNDNILLYGPTNEEMITDLVSNDLRSYKDLPKLLFHTQWKFRDEIRPRFGVMRCREFLMKDAYSFDLDYESSYFSYCKMFILYMKIFKLLGLNVIPVKADSGPIGGALSHEFILETSNGETSFFYDKAILDKDCFNINLNEKDLVIKATEDLLSVYSSSSETHDESLFKKETSHQNQISSKGIEVGHIFYFGTKYSEAFDANYITSNGEKKLIHSGSYGIGVSRLVAAIIEANNDDKGIIWPKQVSPYDLGLINVRFDNRISKDYSEEFYKKFINKYEIIYDDREVRTGKKFNDMDLIGVPLQVIVGEKNILNSNIEVKHRNTGKLELISLDKIESYLEKYCEY